MIVPHSQRMASTDQPDSTVDGGDPFSPAEVVEVCPSSVVFVCLIIARTVVPLRCENGRCKRPIRASRLHGNDNSTTVSTGGPMEEDLFAFLCPTSHGTGADCYEASGLTSLSQTDALFLSFLRR